MEKTMTPARQARRSLSKTYRKDIWNPFVQAMKTYRLLSPGDRVAVCISGGKDSMLLAVLMDMLQKYSDFPFEVVNLSMDPGYSPENRRRIEENAEKLALPLEFFETDIFRVTQRHGGESPCYLCARMRRGYLYARAQALGCNKIALGHHRTDVLETTLLSMFYGGQLQSMPPRLKSTSHPGMELIRPLYCVDEADILRWCDYNDLHFIRCACRFTEEAERAGEDSGRSKRQEMKELLRTLKQTNPNIENNLFNSIHNVHLDTFAGYRSRGQVHPFLERFEEDDPSDKKEGM